MDNGPDLFGVEQGVVEQQLVVQRAVGVLPRRSALIPRRGLERGRTSYRIDPRQLMAVLRHFLPYTPIILVRLPHATSSHTSQPS